MGLKHKNDDYYTISNDTTILNDEPSVNDKPDKAYNCFTKFMITMLATVIWILLTCVIFCPIVIVAYYNQNNISGLAHIMCPIILGLVLLFMFITNKVIIITSNIFDKLESNDDNNTVNSEAKDNTIEDKYNNSINDSNKRMGSAVAIAWLILMTLVMIITM